MSHLSRNRKMKLLAGAVMAGAAAVPSMVQGSPFVLITMLGRDITRGDAAASYVADLGTSPRAPQAGDTIAYKLFVGMASIGTSNSNGGGQTITSLTGAGNADGVNSLSFDAFQVTTGPAAVVQGDLKLTVAQKTTTGTAPPYVQTVYPAEGVSLVTAFHVGTGSSGGVLQARGNGNNDLVTIRPVRASGNFAGGGGAVLLGTGTFVATSGSGDPTISLRWNATGNGGFHINGSGPGAAGLFATTASEVAPGTDPYVALTGIGPVPEPGSLTLLGLGAAGLLARRKNKKA